MKGTLDEQDQSKEIIISELEHRSKHDVSVETDIFDSKLQESLTINLDSVTDDNSLKFKTPRNLNSDRDIFLEITPKKLFYSNIDLSESSQNKMVNHQIIEPYARIKSKKKEFENAYGKGQFIEENFDKVWGMSQQIVLKTQTSVGPKNKPVLNLHKMVQKIDHDGAYVMKKHKSVKSNKKMRQKSSSKTFLDIALNWFIK